MRALESALGCEDLFEWVETQATNLAGLGSSCGRVKFSEQLLRSRGIGAVVKENSDKLPHDAVIEFTGSTYQIRYSATRPTRIRFSMAHEIGHTYFADTRGRPVSKMDYRTDPTIESMCDYFARALLLPRERVIARLRELVGHAPIPPLHLIPQLANEFEVSGQSVARRLVFDLFEGYISATCITKPRQDGDWQTTWCTPLGEHHLPKASGWRIPLASRRRRIPPDMVPTCESRETTLMCVDGRWADLSTPKTIAQCRVPFSKLSSTGSVEAAVALVVQSGGLFDAPSEKCFLALRKER